MHCQASTLGKLSRQLLSLVLFAFLVMSAVPSPVHTAAADEVRMVEGLIENWPVDSIKVRGTYYDITGARLVNTDGEPLSREVLKKGQKVEISLRGERVASVLLFEPMAE